MCSDSIVGPDVSEWCGTGWTGQPNVIQMPDGSIEVREGAYDGQYHFLDGLTGDEVRPNYRTRDLAKGSATSDPDGFPLYYGGSRDGHLRILAFDRPQPTLLWSVNSATSVPLPLRNDDWDGAPLIVGDYMLEGGENGWFYVIRLGRGYDPRGLVEVDPEIVATIAGFDDQLLSDLGDEEVSIEGSVVFRKGIVYFANSGGLVQGWDISDLLNGGTEYRQVLRFWAGDDVDASLVMDQAGFLYVAAEYQRFNERAREVGQLLKLDPRRPDDPVVWSLEAREIGFEGAGESVHTRPVRRGGDLLDRGGPGVARRSHLRRRDPGAGRRCAVDRITRRRRRCLDPGDCARRPLRLGHLGSQQPAAIPVDVAPRWMRGIDTGRLARLVVPRDPGGVPLRDLRRTAIRRRHRRRNRRLSRRASSLGVQPSCSSSRI